VDLHAFRDDIRALKLPPAGHDPELTEVRRPASGHLRRAVVGLRAV